MLVLLLFFCSGATALVYEVLWSKYLTLMLGSTVQAQTVVLAVFMGGLAIGNRLFGKRSAAIHEPLRTYGILELIIGTYAFLFPTTFHLADLIFIKLGSAVVDLPLLPLITKLLTSIFLLLAPTILMGGTLPLLAAWIQRQTSLEASARVGLFYAVNSLGAVVGAGLAGFFLVQSFGLVSALELTALLNLFVAMIAIILAKRESLELRRPAPTSAVPELESPPAEKANLTWLGIIVALTGAVSMGLEVAFSRALAMIAGGSTQSFALVLMSFILGIGLGSVVISSSRYAKKFGVSVIYTLLTAAAVFVLIHVLLIERWAVLYTNARYGLAPNFIGYIWHEISVGLLAFFFLGLPAAFIGAVVPLAIRLAEPSVASLGDRVGQLLTWNTLGAVAGVLVTGFILMPLVGLRSALAILGLILLAVNAWIASRRAHSGVMMVSVLLAVCAIAGLASTGQQWRWVMSAGLFRVRGLYLTEAPLQARKQQAELVFYKDSADATVSVERATTNGLTQLTLRINGKSDASTLGDVCTQYLLAHLPMMARPDAKNVFVLGFGSGITGGALLGHPIEHLTIAENCKPVLEAGSLFAVANRGVLTNSRVRIINDDARAVLKLRPDKYDVIVSEPSNPWVVGVGSVFNQDFYKLCASRLTDGGVMAQWFHKYEMSDDIVFLIFRTFASVFPNMEIWDTQEGDLVLLGSTKPWASDPAHYQAVFDRTMPARDLKALRINTPVALWARQVASQKIASAIAGDGPIQSDEFPLLEYAAPKAFFLGAQANHMYFFDERTIQFPLADRSKIEALRHAPKQDILDAFSVFRPSNPDILNYLQAIVDNPDSPRVDPLGEIIFRPPDSYPANPIRPEASTRARPEAIECIQAEVGLLRDDAHWQTYAHRIESILTTLIGKNEKRPENLNPKYYAALAVRSAIGHNDYETALRILRLGFVFDYYDEQTLFLSRVLDRIVPPELLQKTKAADQLHPSSQSGPR